MRNTLILLINLLWFAGCGDPPSTCPEAGDTMAPIATQANTLLTAKCAMCHGKTPEKWTQFLQKKVVPNDPANSPIFQKVQDGSMPKGGARLSDACVKIVHDWIADGAH